MTLKRDLEEWDGKSSGDIRRIYAQYVDQASFSSNLIKLMKNVNTQKGATWLLKHYIENDNTLKQSQSNAVLNIADKLEAWESKLHLLQSLPYISISKFRKETVEHFIRACLTEKNKFVRAWAYNSFYLLAKQYPEYEHEMELFLEMAMRDEAPSVKARIRNILKKTNKAVK